MVGWSVSFEIKMAMTVIVEGDSFMLFALMQYQEACVIIAINCFIIAINLISLKTWMILFSYKNPQVRKSDNNNSVLHMALKTAADWDWQDLVTLWKSNKDKNVERRWRKVKWSEKKWHTSIDKPRREIVQAARANRGEEKKQAYLTENSRVAGAFKACPPCWLSCSVLLLHCDRPTMAPILAPRLERRFLFPARPVVSGPVLLGLFSRLYMAPLMLELRNTFLVATTLIPPGLGTSTELLSIMVLHKPLGAGLDWGWEEDRGWKYRCIDSIMKQSFLLNFLYTLVWHQIPIVFTLYLISAAVCHSKD